MDVYHSFQTIILAHLGFSLLFCRKNIVRLVNKWNINFKILSDITISLQQNCIHAAVDRKRAQKTVNGTHNKNPFNVLTTHEPSKRIFCPPILVLLIRKALRRVTDVFMALAGCPLMLDLPSSPLTTPLA